MMKRRGLQILMMLVLICTLGISACKKDVGTPEDNAVTEPEEEEGEGEGEAEEESYVIGFSAIDMENPYFITLESAAREALEAEGCQMITKDPGTDPDLQASQIQEMIDEGIDAILLTPVNWEEITPSLQALQEAGIKILNVDAQVKEMDYVDAYIGSDNYTAGQLCGEDLMEKQPEGGKIAILECPTQNSVNDRITGFEETIADAENGFEVVARADTGGQFERALEETQEILKEFPDLTAIMCGNDQMAVGAKTAVNLAEMKDVIIYGVDGSPDIKKELKKTGNQIAGTAAQSPINMGKSAAELVLKMLKGEPFERETYEEVFMINAENVDMYGTDGWQ